MRIKYWKGNSAFQTLSNLHGQEEALKRLKYVETAFPLDKTYLREGRFCIEGVVFHVVDGVCYRTPSSPPSIYFYNHPWMSEKEFSMLEQFISVFGYSALSKPMQDQWQWHSLKRDIHRKGLITRLHIYKLFK